MDVASESTDLKKLNDSMSPRQRSSFALNRSHNTSDTSDGLNESRNDSGANDRKRKLSFSSTQSNENDKVSVVRAAGTFFPQNCNDDPPLSLIKDEVRKFDNGKHKCPVEGCTMDTINAHFHCDACNEVSKIWPTVYHDLNFEK